MHECHFVLDRDFIRRGLRRDHFWWSVYSVLFFAAVLALVGWIYGYAILREPVVLTAMGGGLAVIVLVRWLVYRRSIEVTHEMLLRMAPDKVVHFLADDEHLTMRFENGEQRYRWSDLRRLWRYPDVWLVEIVRNRSLLFQPSAASPEMRDFITERCRAAGLKVDHVI